MAEKAGIGGRLGVKKETTFATYVAPTVAVPFDTESLERNNQYVKTMPIKAGQLAQPDLQHTLTTHDAAGDINGDVLGSGFGSILNLLHGNVVTPALIATGVYAQTHDVGLVSPNGKSLVAQVGRPDVGGTVRVFSYLGGKVVQLVLTMALQDVLKYSASLDFAEEDTGQTLAVPAYDTVGRTLPFQGGSVVFDGVVVTDCVRTAKVTFTLALKTDRYCIGGTAIKKEQILNGPIAATAELGMEFSSMTQHTAFTAATRRRLQLKCLGTLIDATNPQKLEIDLPATVTTKSGPVIAGPDVIEQNLTLEAVLSGASPLASLLYQSADSAVA